MPTDALVLAPLLLAVVLAASAVGKLRSPEPAAAAFTSLRVPKALSRPWMVRALPWGEALLAVGLVLLGGPAAVVVAALTLVLFVAYLVVVVRARGFDEDVDCACFGSLGPGTVTSLTVWRNAWFVLVATLGLVAATQGRSVLGRVADESAPWWWLVGAAAAAATAVLVVGLGAGSNDGDAAAVDPIEMAVEEGDYVRSRTPALPITLGDGSLSHLRQLTRQRAMLLVYVSDWCASCKDVLAALPAWRDDLAPLEVRLVVRQAPDASPLTSADEPQSLHDTEGLLNESFGMRSTPSAILLGADGLLAGGPAIGRDAVLDFVDDIKIELGADV